MLTKYLFKAMTFLMPELKKRVATPIITPHWISQNLWDRKQPTQLSPTLLHPIPHLRQEGLYLRHAQLTLLVHQHSWGNQSNMESYLYSSLDLRIHVLLLFLIH